MINKEAKKHWKAQQKNRLIKSKSSLYNNLFWVCVFTFWIGSLVLNIIDLMFGYNAIAKVVNDNNVVVGTWTWYEVGSYVNSNTNKVIKLVCYLGFISYAICVFIRVIKSEAGILWFRMLIFMIILSIIYDISNLPVYWETMSSEYELVQEFCEDSSYLTSGENLHIEHSFGSFFMNYHFWFSTAIIAIPLIFGFFSLLLWTFTSKTDTLVV